MVFLLSSRFKGSVPISSVFLFYIFIHAKFLVDSINDIISNVILILIVVVVYMIFVREETKFNYRKVYEN